MEIRFDITSGDAVVLARFLRTLGDDEAGFAELAQVAAADPGLAASILKLANSSYYGLAGSVERLEFACAIVGILGLRSLTVAELARRQGPYPEGLAAFTMLLAAQMAERSPHTSVDPQVALSTGLVATLGWILAAQQDPVGYATWRDLALEDRRAFEVERWGRPLASLSQEALRHWAFPEVILDAVGELDAAGDVSTLGRLLRESWRAASERLGPDGAMLMSV